MQGAMTRLALVASTVYGASGGNTCLNQLAAKWQETRYELFSGSPGSVNTSDMELLGSASSIAHGEWPRSAYTDARLTFLFEGPDERPLPLALAALEDAGVGHQVWDAAIVMALYQRSKHAPLLPKRPRVLELGAGVGLPGLDFARRGAARVCTTDSRPELLDLLRRNAEAAEAAVEISVELLSAWSGRGGRHSGNQTEGLLAHAGAYDVVLGSDLCYNSASVPSLARTIRALRAAVTVITGPLSRPSLSALASALEAIEGIVQVEQRLLTLVARPLWRQSDGVEQASSVHVALIVTQ
jgi:predicted nicotinamide N-methyase